MCSTLEMRLAMLRAAIDEVAVAARDGRAGHTGPDDLASRVAGLWAMIAELDPALAARLHGYGPDAGWDKPLCRHPGRMPSLPRVFARDHADRSRGSGVPDRLAARAQQELSNRPQPPIAGSGGSAPGQAPRATAKAAGGR